jgi:hypothetical protein
MVKTGKFTGFRQFIKEYVSMDRKILAICLSVCCILLCSQNTFAQTAYAADSLAVRAILDSNNLSALTVSGITQVDHNRIVYLNLENRGLTVLPAPIGQLSALKFLYLKNNSLKSLPDEIVQLDSILDASFDGNRLCIVGDSIRAWLGMGELSAWTLTRGEYPFCRGESAG